MTGVLQQLSTQDAAAADKLKQRLADAKQALLVPQHTQMLHRHAVRLLVQQAADSIDTAAETAKQVVLQHKIGGAYTAWNRTHQTPGLAVTSIISHQHHCTPASTSSSLLLVNNK